LIRRSFFSVFSDDLATTRDWYVSLFGYRVSFDSDWFVHLQSADTSAIELGILLHSHEIVPEVSRGAVAGGLLTVVVPDVDQLHQKAICQGIEVLEAPRNLFYGQRRMLLTDPNGLVVDVSSECPPDPAWLINLSS